MRAESVVPGEPVEYLVVEEGDVCQEQVIVVIDELMLNSAIESLDMGVHLG